MLIFGMDKHMPCNLLGSVLALIEWCFRHSNCSDIQCKRLKLRCYRVLYGKSPKRNKPLSRFRRCRIKSHIIAMEHFIRHVKTEMLCSIIPRHVGHRDSVWISFIGMRVALKLKKLLLCVAS
jgi:hypothetical protein